MAKQQFMFDGYLIAPENIKRFKIVQTSNNSIYYIDQHNQKMLESRIADMSTNRKSLASNNGEDVTNIFIEEAKISANDLLNQANKQSEETPDNKNIFIVHGRDSSSMHELYRLLQDEFNLNPFILSEQPHEGAETILEKFERLATDCSMAAILLTPDDTMSDGETRRARQNVILELGYFLGRQTRNKRKIMIFYKGNLEIPTDISGVIYYHYNNSIEELYLQLKRQLKLWGH